MRIPRDFDRWMFDYKEGNLSHSEISYFENYMSDNPHHNSDVKAWDNSYIEKTDVIYSGVSNLIKTNKTKVYFGWVALIVLILSSGFGANNYFNNKTNNLYSLRNQSLNIKVYPTNKIDNSKTTTKINNLLLTNNTQLVTTANLIAIKSKEEIDNISTKESDNYQISTNLISTEATLKTKANYSTSKRNDLLLKTIEISKIKNIPNSKNSSSYTDNPKYSEKFTASISKKSKRKNNSLKYKVNKIYRKIEKITGYPVGLINLKDPEFITPNISLFDVNAGFVGNFGKTRFETKHRNQWLGKDNNLQSTSINIDTYSKSIKGGIGASLIYNNFNNSAITDQKLNFFYSPKFAITKNLIFEPAIKLSLGLMTINNSKLTANKPYEIERGRIVSPIKTDDLLTANNLWYKDYGLGFVLNAEKFYFGFNADNLAQHKQSVYGENTSTSIDYRLILGMDYQSKSRKMIFSPFITYQNNTFVNELWGGFNSQFYWLTVGTSVSTTKDFSASIGIKTRNFKLIYQYDITTSTFASQKMGSHTIGIRINTKRKH